jgi:choline kinase
MQIILLAAGKGSRLPSKLRHLPKSMVEINKRTILDHNLKFYNYFKYKTIVTGYKSNKLKKFIIKNQFKEVKNKFYHNTNMVHSLFKVNKILTKEVVICYTDIIFDAKIFLNLKNHKNKNLILLKKNWLKVWRGRMKSKDIINDAEDIKIKKDILFSIGGKIKKKLPKYQYMGIIKLLKKDIFKLNKFYKKIENEKIDFTSFINLAIENHVIKLNISVTNKFWYEIDSLQDIKFAQKDLW